MFENLESEITEKGTAPMVSYFWKGLALFLLGVIAGFFFAPIKKGVSFGNNNGNYSTFGGDAVDICCDPEDDDDTEE